MGIRSVQATLVIRRFVIRGFDYPRTVNCVQNLFRGYFPWLSMDFALFNGNMNNKIPKPWSLVIQGFGICGIF
jgi:hypothetical protein